MSIDDMILLLESVGIKTIRYGHHEEYFERYISFRVYDIEYTITWFKNESTLSIGQGERAACIPFKYIYFDNTYPLIKGNKSIGFSYHKNEKQTVFDRMYPYEVLRIPLEL